MNFDLQLSQKAIWLASLFLAGVLALGIVGIGWAQSQLPGVRLTTDPANDLRPAWSPDGHQIAFFSLRSGNNDIWVMDDDGQNQRQLTTAPGDDRRPAWSPDGKYLAFDSDRTGQRNIWVMEANGQNQRQLTNSPAHHSFPAWSPDGSQIAFYAYQDGGMDIWLVAVEEFLRGGEAGQPQRVTTGLAQQQQNQCTFACHRPAWSPDSTRIAYTGMNHTQVWVVGMDGSNPHPLTDHALHAHFPWWAPDGNILFLSETINDQRQPVNDVWSINAGGDNPTKLFEDIAHGGPLEFRSDGVTVTFHSPRAGNFDIYMTSLGGP
ncbi:MAG: LpqB family beta-propeller domain-containing protein [Anaerolineae bacterium]